MTLEIVDIEITPGMEGAFEEGVARAAPLFRRAKGCRSMTLRRSHEYPSRYRMMVEWETLEDHTVHFRGSDDFQAWRKLVAHCFARPPQVEHADLVANHF